MTDGITQDQFKALRREVQETKWLVHGVMQAIIGKERSDKALRHVQVWLEAERFRAGTPVTEVDGFGTAYWRLLDADLYTLEEVAARPRDEVASIKGIGKVSMGRIEAAMAERGLSFSAADFDREAAA